MTAIIHLAVYDTMADYEVGHVVAHLNSDRYQRRPGRFRVVTVAEQSDPVTTMGGMHIVPEMRCADLRPVDSAMLILPGADTWLTGGNAAFAAKAAEFLAADTPVAAICGATGGLAAAGLLDDRRHTSNAREFLEAVGYGGGSRYVDEPAVTDGKLVTASALAPVEFAREVFGLLGLYEPEVLAAWYRLFGLRDPAAYDTLMAAGA